LNRSSSILSYKQKKDQSDDKHKPKLQVDK